MSFWSLILTFAPWVVFKIITKLPFFTPVIMVKVALIVSFIVSLYQMRTGLHKGIILWAGIIYFAFCFVSVVVLDNVWIMKHMGVLANATFASMTWLTMIQGKPFTMDYAKEYVPQEYWQTKKFISRNYLITGIWAISFSVNFIDSLIKLYYPKIAEWVFASIDDVVLWLTIILTVHLSKRKKDIKEHK